MYNYTYVGHCSQSSVRQWNLSSDANRGVSTLRRSLDGVDSSGDKTTITTIPTVGVYSDSDKKTTFPAFQDEVLVPRNKYVLGSESTSSERIYATMLLYISVCLRTRKDTISYSFIYIVQKLELEIGDRDRDCGTPKLWYTLKLWTGTVVLRNYSEITPKLWLAIVLY